MSEYLNLKVNHNDPDSIEAAYTQCLSHLFARVHESLLENKPRIFSRPHLRGDIEMMEYADGRLEITIMLTPSSEGREE